MKVHIEDLTPRPEKFERGDYAKLLEEFDRECERAAAEEAVAEAELRQAWKVLLDQFAKLENAIRYNF